MTDQQELDRLLGAFFVEGTNEVADRVIDAALIEIDHTQQRRGGRLPRRLMTMKTPMRVAAAAVIGVIAVGGTLYAVNPWQSAVGPSSMPGVSVGPSASAGPSVVPAAGPTWTVTGRMVVPRSGGSATLLPDGTVLVAGGGSAGRSTWAELFDPVSGSWSATGQMGQFSGNPMSVLLPDGTVLIGSGDLYESRAKTWAHASAEGMPRGPDGGTPGGFEAMFVMRDGKVLALGARGRTALYDPIGRSWTTSGVMVTSRSSFAAAMLADGRVLVVGGGGVANEPTASAELYDPGSGSWTATGSMIRARDALTATSLPDGRVLVVGGSIGEGRTVVPTGGELYDPVSGTWSGTAALATPRFKHTATLLNDGRVLIAGGSTGAGDPLTAAEVYDPVDGKWSATANMVTPHVADTATLLSDGRVLVTGQTAEIYDAGPAN